MYIFLNRSFIDKISVFPIYFLIKIFHDTCQTLATGDTYAVFVTSRVRTETRASSASVYVSSVPIWRTESVRATMNYSCVLCDCSLIESRYRYTVSGRSSFNILDAIKSLPFNVIVTGQSYVCRTCFARLKKRKV